MDTSTLSALSAARWSPERAQAWHASLPWLMGANFTPSTASNQLEFWQAATFDPTTIARELDWAADLGMNSMRIFLHNLCWEEDHAGFLARIDQVLTMAHARGIGALVVFFDSCWYPDPQPGTQQEPLPRIHNSRWVQSPGAAVVRDAARFALLKPYVQGVMARFANDRRIHGWDLWNEPENHSSGKPYEQLDIPVAEKASLVMERLAQVFAWAREVAPLQPLTSGIWQGDFAANPLTPIQRLQVEASDIISFHKYDTAAALEACIATLSTYGRPLWCTEYMARTCGSTFATNTPVLHRHGVGAWNWGLVAGRSQTQYSWQSWLTTPTADPDPWFHDVLHHDGRPYDLSEVHLLHELRSRV